MQRRESIVGLWGKLTVDTCDHQTTHGAFLKPFMPMAPYLLRRNLACRGLNRFRGLEL